MRTFEQSALTGRNTSPARPPTAGGLGPRTAGRRARTPRPGPSVSAPGDPPRALRSPQQSGTGTGGHTTTYTDPVLAGGHLARKLGERPRTLLVLDDVYRDYLRAELGPSLIEATSRALVESAA